MGQTEVSSARISEYANARLGPLFSRQEVCLAMNSNCFLRSCESGQAGKHRPWLSPSVDGSSWCLCGLLLILGPNELVYAAQLPPQLSPEKGPKTVVIRPPRQLEQALAEAEAHLARDEFAPAVRLLQTILDQPEDYFLDEECRLSTKQRALELLRSMPAAGRQVYELEVNPTAAALLEQAVQSEDLRAWSELARRFTLTPSASVALQRLAARAFDSGDFLAAALLWERLLEVHPQNLSPTTKAQLALAWELAGHSDRASERLRAIDPPRITQGGKAVSLLPASPSAREWLRSQAESHGSILGAARSDWTENRGGGTRHQPAQSAGPVGGIAWRVPVQAEITLDSWESSDSPWREDQPLVSLLGQLTARMLSEDKLIIPAASPIVVDDIVVFRSLKGLTAVDRTTGKLLWRTLPVDPLANRIRQVLETTHEATSSPNVAPLFTLVQETLFRDVTWGSLSTDGRHVFAVVSSDLSIAHSPERQRLLARVPTAPPPTNKLVAYALHGGRLLAEIGGPRDDPALPLGGYFFFGPPLVHRGRLFALAEAAGVVRLLQLRMVAEPTPHFEVEWAQALAAPGRLLNEAPLRRLAGMAPSAAGSLLICPTTAGLVVAVDPIQQKLCWGYQYDSLEPARIIDPRQAALLRNSLALDADEETTRWLEPYPVIAGGRVLLTPRDSDELHCLDLLTGALLWKRPRGQNLMIAGVVDNQHVVLVGVNALEALRLEDGEPAWPHPISIPVPSGRGLLLGSRYLLPLNSGEIATVDLREGRILARTRLEDGIFPGNLAAGRTVLVSQSLQGLVGFAPESHIEAEIAARLSRNRLDPVALSRRGELRLHRGDLEAGLADLRLAFQTQADPQTSRALASALLQCLRIDFDKYHQSIEELDQLELDQATRQEFLKLLAESLAERGRITESLKYYLRLIQSAVADPSWLRVDDELVARGDRFLQGRIASLYQQAHAAQRQELDAEIHQLLAAATEAEPALQRQLLRYLGHHPASVTLRQRVLEHDLATNPPAAYRTLLALACQSGPEAPYATWRLAEWLRQQNRASLAWPWLNRLAGEYLNLPVHSGKTGAEWLAEWQLDAQELSLRNAARWNTEMVDVVRSPRQPVLRRIRWAELAYSTDPRFQAWSFEIVDDAEQQLVARDGAGRVQWKITVPNAPDEQQIRYVYQVATPRIHVAGPWLGLSIGLKFVIWELTAEAQEPQFRWQYNLNQHGLAGINLLPRPQLLPNGRRRLRSPEGQIGEPLGQLVGLTTEAVVYHSGRRLVAADPTSGTALWFRQLQTKSFESTVSEKYITLLETETGTAYVYRCLDGGEVARRSVGPPEVWLWFQGERLLTLTPSGTGQKLALQDLATGQYLWSHDVPANVCCRVVQDTDILVLTADGTLRCHRLTDGQAIWQTPLQAVKASDYLWARKQEGRYDVVIRQMRPAARQRRALPFDINQIVVAGHAAAVEASTGRLLWQREIGPTAFDVLLPPQIPLLPFVARADPSPEQTRRDLTPTTGLSALFLDARTGEILYETWESATPSMFQMELDGDRRTVTANFWSWSLEFRWAED